MSLLFCSGTNSKKPSPPSAFASGPVRRFAASPSRFSRVLARSCKQCASRVYFQPRRRRRRGRRRRRENSLQGGEQQSRWLRGESTFFWKQLSVFSHSLLFKKNTNVAVRSLQTGKRGPCFFLKNTATTSSQLVPPQPRFPYKSTYWGRSSAHIYQSRGRLHPRSRSTNHTVTGAALLSCQSVFFNQKMFCYIAYDRTRFASTCDTALQDGDMSNGGACSQL